jgi:hypothetical protein
MNGSPHIQYISNRQIEKSKWNNCIQQATNGLIYGYSFYLDRMSKNWDALILNDYEAVMPLPWNRKYGINYLYQPFITAQLGVFGNNITEQLVHAFIKAIPSSFQFVDLSLNYKNFAGSPPAQSFQRNNYILNINKPYQKLYSAFSENIQRNIKKAKQLGCSLQKDINVEKIIELALQQMNMHNKESDENDTRFRNLYQYLSQKNMAGTYGIVSADNELLASCVFFYSHNRAYYVLVGNHPNSKDTGASHALIDGFIKENAGKNMLLDFEGSDIKNLALFYKSFGALNEMYPSLKINRLPFYLKWLKK